MPRLSIEMIDYVTGTPLNGEYTIRGVGGRLVASGTLLGISNTFHGMIKDGKATAEIAKTPQGATLVFEFEGEQVFFTMPNNDANLADRVVQHGEN